MLPRARRVALPAAPKMSAADASGFRSGGGGVSREPGREANFSEEGSDKTSSEGAAGASGGTSDVFIVVGTRSLVEFRSLRLDSFSIDRSRSLGLMYALCLLSESLSWTFVCFALAGDCSGSVLTHSKLLLIYFFLLSHTIATYLGQVLAEVCSL